LETVNEVAKGRKDKKYQEPNWGGSGKSTVEKKKGGVGNKQKGWRDGKKGGWEHE